MYVEVERRIEEDSLFLRRMQLVLEEVKSFHLFCGDKQAHLVANDHLCE